MFLTNTQLVPLAALYAELGKELKPANAQEKLERWFWCGVLGEMYGSAVETRFANDLAQVARYVREGVEPELLTQAILLRNGCFPFGHGSARHTRGSMPSR